MEAIIRDLSGMLDGAFHEFQKTLALNPYYFSAYINTGRYYTAKARTVTDAAGSTGQVPDLIERGIKAYEQTLALNPGNKNITRILSSAYERRQSLLNAVNEKGHQAQAQSP